MGHPRQKNSSENPVPSLESLTRADSSPAALRSVDSLLQAIRDHKLMPMREWGSMRERWLREDRKEISEVPAFCRWLVSNTYLSALQVRYLSRGQAQLLYLGGYRIRDRMKSQARKGGLIAEDVQGRRVIMEIFASQVVKSATLLNALRQRVGKLMRLKHPNIGKVLDLASDRGLTYLLKELYEGETLSLILRRRGKLHHDAATRLFAFALAALQHLHENGLPGGDLSSDCLFLTAAHGTQSPEVKVLDVGVPRRLFDSSSLTRAGERSREKPPLPVSLLAEVTEPVQPVEDIFRLGCTFYLALTGKAPYPPRELSTPTRAVPLRQLVPDVPEMLADLVHRMIDPDGVKRPANAGHAARALRIILAVEEQSHEDRLEEKLALPTAPARKMGLEQSMASLPPEKKKTRVVSAPRAPVETNSVAEQKPSKPRKVKREIDPMALLYGAAGVCLFITCIILLQLLTGWEMINLVCLLAGTSFSFLADQLVRWKSRSSS